MYRTLALAGATLALALFVTGSALAEKKAGGKHEGTVVKAGDGKLTMTGKKSGKEHTHEVAEDAKITCDGKECKLDDLKAGTTVRVEVKDNKVVSIEGTSKNSDDKPRQDNPK